ncbi:MAG: hypothetical protein R3B93_08200 [Bacteroidia bacterium]
MMKKLNADWFLEGTLDFEYKKYVLLAYLQHVSKEFAEVKLYPSFSDLIFHYNNLFQFKESKKNLTQKFPSQMSEEEFRNLSMLKETDLNEQGELQEIEHIVEYAIPTIKSQMKEGKEIYDYIDDHVTIEPIGITPLYKNEGYILLRVNPRKEVKVFEYKIVFFENTDANYHGISFSYLDSYTHSIANTYESMKLKLIRNHTKLPNPATYLVYTVHPFPEETSLIPVAKRKILSYLK